MNGYISNIEKITKENKNFRQVLYTGKHSQLVVMRLKPGEDIGEEIHTLDQFIRIEQGSGQVILNGVESEIKEDYAIVIPAGVKHNVVNSSLSDDMKLYTVYSPPEHKDGIVHLTKNQALNDLDDHFDGKTTEK
ncbi:cupin domain-containing protein [Patescibacteria group bacterium]|nr:cupin domain-containing protein [Patescibacteria group bacterium]